MTKQLKKKASKRRLREAIKLSKVSDKDALWYYRVLKKGDASKDSESRKEFVRTYNKEMSKMAKDSAYGGTDKVLKKLGFKVKSK